MPNLRPESAPVYLVQDETRKRTPHTIAEECKRETSERLRKAMTHIIDVWGVVRREAVGDAAESLLDALAEIRDAENTVESAMGDLERMLARGAE